jgi:hypothetical protein
VKIWQKTVVIFVGCGLSAVLTYLTTVTPEWATVFGGLQIADLATVGILTGWQPQ